MDTSPSKAQGTLGEGQKAHESGDGGEGNKDYLSSGHDRDLSMLCQRWEGLMVPV